MKTVEVYRGPSRVAPGNVVVLLNLSTGNSKTGASVQAWILDADTHPVTAYQTGAPANCPAACEHLDAGTCYVKYFQAPASMFNAWNRGTYGTLSPEGYGDFMMRAARRGARLFRIGAVGDPAAVPVALWFALVTACRNAGMSWTGYTHAWRSADAAGLRPYVMASVDSLSERDDAREAGWRTFRVSTGPFDDAPEGETRCPASAERGHVATCSECHACNGTSGNVDIVIRGHGAGFSGVKWEV